jgi:hypothetical protein
MRAAIWRLLRVCRPQKGAAAKVDPMAWTVNKFNYSHAARENGSSDIRGNVAAANGNRPKALE